VGVAIPGGDRFGSFSLPAITGDASLPEVFVKMVDRGPASMPWVFYGGLTGLAYRLVITDTTTNLAETYENDGDNRFCGGVDATPFFDDGSEGCPGCWDYVSVHDKSSADGLSLLGGRFSITLSAYSARHGRSEPGVVVAQTDRYGYFSLPGFTGDASFPEVHVKMIDYRRLTGKFWIFYTGLTSLDYTLTVRDSVTGATRTYESPGNYCGSAHADDFGH
jgi:hypothetical protein